MALHSAAADLMVNASIMIVLGAERRSYTRHRNQITNGRCRWRGSLRWPESGPAKPPQKRKVAVMSSTTTVTATTPVISTLTKP
jgi:hypothetical protein